MIDIKVPTVGESISEVTLLKWNKKDGEYVERDEVIAELESEKATFEVNAEQAGVIKTAVKEGDTLKIGDLLASIDETAAKPTSSSNGSNGTPVQDKKPPVEPPKEEKKHPEKKEKKALTAEPPGQQQEMKASPVASAIIAD